MSSLNLAIVISPNFCRCPDVNQILVNTKLETQFLNSLITKLPIPDSTSKYFSFLTINITDSSFILFYSEPNVFASTRVPAAPSPSTLAVQKLQTPPRKISNQKFAPASVPVASKQLALNITNCTSDFSHLTMIFLTLVIRILVSFHLSSLPSHASGNRLVAPRHWHPGNFSTT